MSKNLSELSGRKGLKDNLFEKLGKVANDTGTVDKDEAQRLAEEYLFGDANVYGAATFYDFTKPENKGKKVFICNGSACMTAGSQRHVANVLYSHFDEDEIGEMCCLGRCHENYAFHYKGKNYSGKDIDQLENETLEVSKEKYTSKSLGTSVLMKDLPEDWVQKVKNDLNKSTEDLLEEISASKIRGRGGAGFPMAIKMDTCKNAPGDVKYLVCNADEGDPGAYSDRYLMEEQPFKVLLGMLYAGYIIGAKWGVIYIRKEYPASIDIIQKAINTLKTHGLCGDDLNDHGFTYNFKVIEAQGAYICGEETALLSSIEGQRPEVRVRPPYPAVQGLFNKPTVVNNVETLAAIPFIMFNGGNEYAKIGTSKSSGTKLVCLDSHFNTPGVFEVEMGTNLDQVINELGDGYKTNVKALHIGGPLGGLVPTHKTKDLSIDFESFSENGFLLGHASVVSIPASFSILEYIMHLFEFTAHESCGKCFPCRLGSVRGAEMLKKAKDEQFKIDRQLFNDLLDTLEQGSLCALGGGLPLPVKNALMYFDEELSSHFNS